MHFPQLHQTHIREASGEGSIYYPPAKMALVKKSGKEAACLSLYTKQIREVDDMYSCFLSCLQLYHQNCSSRGMGLCLVTSYLLLLQKA